MDYRLFNSFLCAGAGDRGLQEVKEHDFFSGEVSNLFMRTSKAEPSLNALDCELHGY